jgi:hypothetical protein
MLHSGREKLLVNFEGPFKYDIVSHVKRVQRWVQTSVKEAPVYMYIPSPVSPPSGATAMDKDISGAINATSTETEAKPSVPSTTTDKPTADQPGLADKVHLCHSCGEPNSIPTTRRKKLVTDIDSALSNSVLEYLRGGGYLDAARGMESVLQSRRGKVEDEHKVEVARGEMMDIDDATTTGQSDVPSPSNTTELKTTANQAFTEDRRLILSKTCRDAYGSDDIDLALSTFFTSPSPWTIPGNNPEDVSRPASWFLHEQNQGLWAFRFRMRNFYRLYLDRPVILHPEFSKDVQEQIRTFYYGVEDESSFSSSPSASSDKLQRLLTAGRQISSIHGESTLPEIVQGLKVFGVMAYEDESGVPEKLKSRMTGVCRRREAAALFKDLRGEFLVVLG